MIKYDLENFNKDQAPPLLKEYFLAAQDFLNCLNEEESFISQMNIKALQLFEIKKASSFKSYKSTLENLLKSIHAILLTQEMKDFIKDSQKIIQQKMNANMRLLKIEKSLLDGLFSDLSKQFERPVVTYKGLKKTFKPAPFASFPTKEL
ncbi:MAG: hypothetical protein HEEMFOPI_00427 [Holosporales bacterium]